MKRFKTELAADRLRKSYLGQLQEARERLESEANVKEQLASDKARLEQQLAKSYTPEAYEVRLSQLRAPSTAKRQQRDSTAKGAQHKPRAPRHSTAKGAQHSLETAQPRLFLEGHCLAVTA